MRGWNILGKCCIVATVASLLFLTGCGGSQDQNNTNTNTNSNTNNNQTNSQALTYHKDARAIIEAKCQNCHSPGNIGPFSLSNFQEVLKFKAAIRDSVQAGRMPPWQPDDSCNEYQHNIGMSKKEKNTLIAWIDEGAVEGDESTYKKPELRKPPEFRADVEAKLPEPYTPVKKPDDYRCFIVDWPHKEDKYITGYKVVADNKQIAHHLIAFVVPPDLIPTFQKYDDAEKGAGYTCYGGPTGAEAGNDIRTLTRLRWIGAWAPGVDIRAFPPGVGVKIPGGSKIILQMHYNVVSNNPKPDQSKIQFQVTDKVEKEALIQPYADPAWVVGRTMEIPAGSSDTSHSYTRELSSKRTVMLHGVGLHMHTRGRSASVIVERANGKDKVCGLRIQKWDFNWQNSYGLKKPILIKPGDKVKLSCTWDNSAANQPMIDGKKAKPQTLNWGDGTFDEMCLGTLFLTYE